MGQSRQYWCKQGLVQELPVLLLRLLSHRPTGLVGCMKLYHSCQYKVKMFYCFHYEV